MYFDISLSFPRQTTLVFLYSYINVCLGYMSCKLLVLVSIFTEFTIIITVSQTHLSQYLHSAYLFIIYVYLVILHTSHVYISLWTWCIQKTCELIKFILLMHQFFLYIISENFTSSWSSLLFVQQGTTLSFRHLTKISESREIGSTYVNKYWSAFKCLFIFLAWYRK